MSKSHIKYSSLIHFESFNDTFSPSRIFAQIIILQSFYYITAVAMFCFLASLSGYPFTFDWIFSWEPITFQNALGLTLTILWIIDSFVCIIFMTIIVGRSKLAWDFALTIHAINFCVCWIYSGKLPSSMLWWGLQIVSSVILVSLGTWTSRWRELRDTFFDGLTDTELGNNDNNEGETIAMKDMSRQNNINEEEHNK
ncbi:hypothetical protein PACTADRAFT_41044 [Pachysolen tannophilus NRRL Y-2460]|uniref:Protein SYS1 n=1 Tax=Pachysolen tannophilus NRRL Y-2460 TaxID=669874 RepID=A0A1E4TWG3_PACTA|nr:hypothetical protein PACTADRAFT_41044 [Pachysolen tannophilus NRRL Y-2460]